MRFTKRQVEDAIRKTQARGVNTALVVGFAIGTLVGMWLMVFLVGLHVVHIDFGGVLSLVKG